MMFLSPFAFALLQLGFTVAQFPFTGKHETARCPAGNRATDKTMSIEIHYVDVNPQGKKHPYLRPWVARYLVHLEAPD